MEILVVHQEGKKFNCSDCKKSFEVINQSHIEITDRLELENIQEKSTKIYLCNVCFEKREKNGEFVPPSFPGPGIAGRNFW